MICGCMTVPVGLVTFFFLPDTPHKTRAWFLTQDDKDLALRRVEEAGKAAPANLTWRKAGRILRGWSEFSSGSSVPLAIAVISANQLDRVVAFRVRICGELCV